MIFKWCINWSSTYDAAWYKLTWYTYYTQNFLIFLQNWAPQQTFASRPITSKVLLNSFNFATELMHQCHRRPLASIVWKGHAHLYKTRPHPPEISDNGINSMDVNVPLTRFLRWFGDPIGSNLGDSMAIKFLDIIWCIEKEFDHHKWTPNLKL